MNKALAQYLFFNETLYQFDDTKAEQFVEEKTEPVVSPAQSKPVKESLPPESKPEFTMATKQLVVVHTFSDTEKEFLGKVLGALNLSLSKVDLFIREQHPETAFKDLIYQYAVQGILFFGTESGGHFLERLKLQKYQIQTLKGVKFLLTDNLKQIGENKANEKRLLWEALQAFYS
ncbi:hypothetical protein LAG90_10235 [Marinilongibacter aquaticus]|uniref:hypothetical protein n=1 Tax=Marinilongibacter aquaticus TaxID=2975157 RepID=UPI0021BDC2DC|nr:hypothetical protein [Marinilongibacter aquaticus]UBM57198.1 hypothetical protein LAG90_10235 [Marinilongibacter aquaticus]